MDTQEREFAELALKKGLVTKDQLEAALAEQARHRERGEHLLLGQILLKHRWLTTQQFVEIIQEQRQTLRIFGRYRLLRQLGRGGMSTVYLAQDEQLRRTVALKILNHPQDPQSIRRLLREARLLASLKHPNIIPMYEYGEIEGNCYYTMEFVHGSSLQDVVAERSMDLPLMLEALETASRALHYVHEQGIVHRDVKPSNIMVEPLPDGRLQIYLMDFGIARGPQAATRLTKTGSLIGTPFYMSPEQVNGKQPDQRSDVYALGVILYEMITGRLPFSGQTELEVYNRIANEDPIPPRKLRPDVSADLERICLKAMEREPRFRYQTALEFADDLARARRGLPVHTRLTPVTYRAWRTLLRRRGVLAGVFGVLVAAVTTFFLTRHSGAPPPKPGRIALEAPVQITEPDAAVPTDFAVFYQEGYPANWSANPDKLFHALKRRGYQHVDLARLRTWMLEHIDSPRRGVIVFSQDTFPEQILETLSEKCTLIRYLAAGNSVIWLADLPAYWVLLTSGERVEIRAGARVLGVREGKWRDGTPVVVTPEGRAWGITKVDVSNRAVLPEDVTTVLTRTRHGEATMWHKNFQPKLPRSGFVQFWNSDPCDGADPEIQRVIHHLALKVSGRLPGIALRVTEPIDLQRYDRIALRQSDTAQISARLSLDNGVTWAATADPDLALPVPEDVSCINGAIARLHAYIGPEPLVSGDQRLHLHRSGACVSVGAPAVADTTVIDLRVDVQGGGELELAWSADGSVWRAIQPPARVTAAAVPVRWDAKDVPTGELKIRAQLRHEGRRAIAYASVHRLVPRYVVAESGGVRWISERAKEEVPQESIRFAEAALRDLERTLGTKLRADIRIREGGQPLLYSFGIELSPDHLRDSRQLDYYVAQGLVYASLGNHVSYHLPEQLGADLRMFLALRLVRTLGNPMYADATARSYLANPWYLLLATLEEKYGWAKLESWIRSMRVRGTMLIGPKEHESVSLHRVLAHLIYACGKESATLVRAAAARAGAAIDNARLDRELSDLSGEY